LSSEPEGQRADTAVCGSAPLQATDEDSYLARLASLEAECEAHAGKVKELEEQGQSRWMRIKELEVP
jgi:hypothetical protein